MSTLGAIITIPYLAAALAAGLGMLLLGVALLACLSRANGSDDQEHKSADGRRAFRSLDAAAL